MFLWPQIVYGSVQLLRHVFGGSPSRQPAYRRERQLHFGYCAVLPYQAAQVLAEHPDAMLAGDFLDRLKRSRDLCGFYDDIALKLLRVASEQRGRHIYVHSPQLVEV